MIQEYTACPLQLQGIHLRIPINIIFSRITQLALEPPGLPRQRQDETLPGWHGLGPSSV